MAQNEKHDTLASRLRKTKAALLAVSLTLAGILLIALNSWLDQLSLGNFSWLLSIPFGELGGILFGAGVLSTLFEYSFRKDQEAATAEQFRAIIKEQAPAMRDAVIEGFAIHPDDLKRVASLELLDTVAENVMGIRLNDNEFASEIYREVRDQAIRAPERWKDVQVNIRLSSALERSIGDTPLFDITVEWEYTTIPSHPVRKFACVSNRDEYNELITDIPATMAWYMTPERGLNASSKEHFELLAFSVDGNDIPIRRTEKKNGQTYSVKLDDDITATDRSVRLRYVLHAVTPKWGHRLHLASPQPAKGFSLTLDYTNTDIADLRISDKVVSGEAVHISSLPAGANARTRSIDVPGWAGLSHDFV